MHPECIGRGHRMAMLGAFIADGEGPRRRRLRSPRSLPRHRWEAKPLSRPALVPAGQRPPAPSTASSIGRRQPAGERVLLAHVVAAEQLPPADASPRRRARTSGAAAGASAPSARERPQRRGPGDTTRARRRRATRSSAASSRTRYGAQLSRSVGSRLVVRRAHDLTGGGDPAGRSPRRPSSAAHAGRPAREAGGVQRRPQEVAAGVAGEHPARAVAAMRRRREPERAGSARPDRRTRAPAGPSTSRPGTARPSPRATASRHATSRGQRRQSTTSASIAARAGAPRPDRRAVNGPRYLSSSLSSRRETIASPTRPITVR